MRVARKDVVFDTEDVTWLVSPRSGAIGNCVEVAHLSGGTVAVRDSKNRDAEPQVYTQDEWVAFTAGVVDGFFDVPSA